MDYSSSEEQDCDLSIESESDHSDTVKSVELPEIVPSPTSSSCDNCGQESSLIRMELACFECANYYLCFSCCANPKILQGHMKTHPELEGRRTRRRKI